MFARTSTNFGPASTQCGPKCGRLRPKLGPQPRSSLCSTARSEMRSAGRRAVATSLSQQGETRGPRCRAPAGLPPIPFAKTSWGKDTAQPERSSTFPESSPALFRSPDAATPPNSDGASARDVGPLAGAAAWLRAPEMGGGVSTRCGPMWEQSLPTHPLRSPSEWTFLRFAGSARPAAPPQARAISAAKARTLQRPAGAPTMRMTTRGAHGRLSERSEPHPTLERARPLRCARL